MRMGVMDGDDWSVPLRSRYQLFNPTILPTVLLLPVYPRVLGCQMIVEKPIGTGHVKDVGKNAVLLEA